MPKSIGLSALQRIEIMDDRLRRDRWWTKEMLFREVNRYLEGNGDIPAAESTLRGDLETIKLKAGEHFLSEMKATEGGGRKKLHVRYDAPDFSFFGASPLEPYEYDALGQAIELLGQIRAGEVAGQLQEIIQKLKSSYDLPTKPRIIFEQPDLKGIDLLQQLYEAISRQQVIGFVYQPFNQQGPLNMVMHPYVLKEYNRRWYVVGLSEPQKAIWVCALDRFKGEPKVKGLAYIGPGEAGFDPLKYFADVIGPTVMSESPVEEVDLKFRADRVPYIITKKLHPSQELLKTFKDGSASFRYRLRYNRELLALILGFGADVKVMAPASLVCKVTEAIRQMANQYPKYLG